MCVLSRLTPAPFAVFVFLILCHIVIAIFRYAYKREIVWPVWADLLAASCGVVLIVSAFVPRPPWYSAVIYFSVGIFIIYGHIKKIFFPTHSYYYDEVPTIKVDKILEF